MENFVLEKSLVQWRHYETGEPLPEDLLEKLRSMKTYMSGTMLLRQLYFGALDLELHHRYDPTEEGAPTPFEVQRRIAERFTVVPPLPEDRFLCSFGHIMAGGYAAGYYSYIWAEQLSSDAFAAFEEAGLDKEEKVAETGRRFADTVLALGGSMHPLDVFKAFRGREPRPDALLRHKGLAQATA
jgi:oligopeptidase A